MKKLKFNEIVFVKKFFIERKRVKKFMKKLPSCKTFGLTKDNNVD